MTNSSKNIQKTSKYSNGNIKIREILFHRFLGEYTLFLTPPPLPPPPPPFFEVGGNENSKKLGRRWNQFLKTHRGKSGGERENTKFVGLMGFSHFNLLAISCHGN